MTTRTTTMTMMVTALVMVLASAAGVKAAEARGAMCDDASRVTATAYYSSGNFHGAMDQAKSGGGCWTSDSDAARYHRGSINTSRRYTYLGGCGAVCGNNLGNRCNGGAGNMISTTGTNGWDWRQMHINRLAGHSTTKTCSRCSFGLIGSTGNSSGGHAHVENRRYGTKSTGWMSGASVGMASGCSRTVGWPRLS